MQTFLPFPSFTESARCLDYRRLGKQRVEAKQIYLALTQPNYGWQNHPAVKMWRGHECALLEYGLFVCREWTKRGYKDSLTQFFVNTKWPGYPNGNVAYPSWLGDPDFHRSHRAMLYSKDPKHYRAFQSDFDLVGPNYIWPTSSEAAG